ncbi:hypothetical protein VIBNIPon4_230028 [Vibrio nigripulchritudo POn4]|nr:hypothetical protein VIBNIAM115_200018 [Vibrio nigripulchritudo AM115]CCN44203.1 hypothetical protein VIBNIFTn2_720019 [Vibrio nigripulchritudo FTn2]CCN64588.1 hypothetical protein VIBNIPon4_230028 [Vibrio nigripulchritudo POn4]
MYISSRLSATLSIDGCNIVLNTTYKDLLEVRNPIKVVGFAGIIKIIMTQ